MPPTKLSPLTTLLVTVAFIVDVTTPPKLTSWKPSPPELVTVFALKVNVLVALSSTALKMPIRAGC